MAPQACILRRSMVSGGRTGLPPQAMIKLLFCVGHVQLCALMVQNSANVNVKAHDNATPLLLAASEGRFNCVQYLLGKGCEDVVFNPPGRPVLLHATTIYLVK